MTRHGGVRPRGAALVLTAALALGGCGTALGQSTQVPAATLPPEAAGLPASGVSGGQAARVPAGADGHVAGADGVAADVDGDAAREDGGVADGASASSGAATGAGQVVSRVSGLVPLEDAEVAELTERMDAVLADGTEDDWAAFFEGEELAEQQRRWLRAVREVPMDVRQIFPDAVVARDVAEGTVAQLVFAHQVSGADPVPAAQTYRVTVRRPPGEEPRISAVEGANRSDGYPQLWDLDAVGVTVTDQLVVLAAEDRQDDVAALLPGLESAVANVFLDFDEGERERLVVQLVDAGTLRQIADDEALAVDPAGVAMAVRGAGEGPAPGELGVSPSAEHLDRTLLDVDLLVDELALGTPPGGWGLMRHEAVHAVVDGDPDVMPPVWVWEGLAEWYGYRRDYLVDAAYRQAVAAAAGEPLELPDSFSDYYYDSQEAGELAYASSAMVFSFLEQRFGFGTARDVGVGLTEADTWYDTDEADALLLQHTGMTLEGLEQEWAAWAVATYG